MIYMVDTADYVEDNTIWGVNVEGAGKQYTTT